jgi:hypothetical protein
MKSSLAPQPSRRVRSLRIRSPAEEDARRAAIVLADALHTASMPVAERGQMLLVRKLELGRISPRASAATLALLVERALRDVRMAAVSFDLPGATGANAVLVPGRAEAVARLARLHARGIEAREWFWAAAVPAWSAGLSRGERWVALLEAAHALPEAVLVTAEVVREAVRAKVEDELLDAVSLGQVRHWLRVEGWSGAAPAKARPKKSLLTPHHAEIIRRWQYHQTVPNEWLTWMVLMLAVAERPARAADAQLPARAAAWLAVEAERVDPGLRAEAKTRGAPARAANDSLPAAAPPEPAITHDALFEPTTAKTGAPVVVAEIEERAELADAAPAISVEDELTPDQPAPNRAAALFGEPTLFAGLLFLVPVLEQLGFAEFLEEHPSLLESHFPARLLLFIGARTGMKPHDPMSLALGDAEPFEFEELRGLPESARALLVSPLPRVQIDTPQIAWLTTLRRWCRRHARIGLASLVRRPGRVSASLTHLDICFDLAAADLRVRRAALDVDPGWVPWLGRVVCFQYLEHHERAL